MLYAALEEYGRRHGKHIAGLADGAVLVVCTVSFVEGRTAEVHRAHGIPDERMDTGVEGLGVAGTLSEVQVL